MNRRVHYQTRIRWEGNRMVTQRFRVRTQPFELVRVKTRRRMLVSDVLVLGFAALALGAFFLVCFRIALELWQ